MFKNSIRLFTGAKKESSQTEYFNNSYPDTHWAHHIPVVGDKNFIATLEIHGIKMGLKLNATDSRGYRAIACLVTDNENNMFSTFNRNYSAEEKLALNTALCVLSIAYENMGMIAQIEIAGNLSQSVTESGTVRLGNEKEPSLLHGHIIGRGNPSNNYIANVPLRGPKAGAMFNMCGNGNDKGNELKTKWEEGEIEVVAEVLANEVLNILKSSPIFQNIIPISVRVENTSTLEI